MNTFSAIRRLPIVVASFISLTVTTAQVAGAVVCDASWRVQSTAAFPAGAETSDVAVTGTGEAWVVGTSGSRALLARLSNGSWTTSHYSVPGRLVSLHSVDAQPGVAWAVGRIQTDIFDAGSPLVLVNDGSGWSRLALPVQAASGFLTSVVVRNRNDVWISGESAGHPLAVHWNGSRLTATALPFRGRADSIEAPPEGGVLLVGLSFTSFNYTAWHSNGDKWTQLGMPPAFGEEFSLMRVDGTRRNMWAVGNGFGGCCSSFPSVHRWNGSRWLDETPATGGSYLQDVLVSRSDGHVVVVGQSPCGEGCQNVVRAQVWDWTGSRWIQQPIAGLSTTAHSELVAVDGDGNGDRWAVGSRAERPLLVRQCVSAR